MTYAVIVAAGTGERAKLSVPKQFYHISDKTIIKICVQKFQNAKNIDKILIIANQTYVEMTRNEVNEFSKVEKIISGGTTRQESVLNGLEYIASLKEKDVFVAIHDVVRPFVEPEQIDNWVELAKKYGAIVPALVEDHTVSMVNDDMYIEKMLVRNKIYRHQTPQIFNFEKLYKSYKNNVEIISQLTDDASIYIADNNNVKIVEGRLENIKLTFERDFEYAKYILNRQY